MNQHLFAELSLHLWNDAVGWSENKIPAEDIGVLGKWLFRVEI